MRPGRLRLFEITIPECNFHAFNWNLIPERAIKEALKEAFERRGVKYFKFQNREFIDAGTFTKYLIEHGLMDQVCREASSIL
jgi:hypothetical protein